MASIEVEQQFARSDGHLAAAAADNISSEWTEATS